MENIPTVRIELPGGNYATIYQYRLRRTARLYAAELQRQSVYYDVPTALPLSELTPASVAPVAMMDWAKQDVEALNEITVLNQVTSWSFGAVDRDTLDGMPDDCFKALVADMELRYAPDPKP